MQTVSTIGLDIAKSLFQVHGIDAAGQVGGRARLGSISKKGDRYLRGLFVAGALAVIRYAKLHGTKYRPWVAALLARRPTKVAAIALANKLSRMAWAMMARGERYNYPAALRV
jgi:transposase